MSPLFRREYPEPELKRIVITLLGGSNSGKTAFFSGIQQSLVNDERKLGADGKYRISFKPVSIRRGIARVNESNELEEHTDDHNNETAAGAAFQMLSEGFTAKQLQSSPPAFAGGNVPPAFASTANGTGYPPAFSGSSTEKPKNDSQVNNIDVSGSDQETLSDAMKLVSELRQSWGVDAVRGFQAGTATTRYIELTFEVLINNEPKCLLTITDYAGEIIDNANKVPDQMLGMLARHIRNSDAAIVLASARDLSKTVETTYTADQNMFQTLNTKEIVSADRINNLIKYLEKKDFSILLAVTQIDSPQVDERISSDHFFRAMHDLREYIYGPTFNRASDKNWSCGIIPVTAIGYKRNGEPNVDMNNMILPDATINQMGIDVAVLFTLYNAILAHEKEMRPEAIKLQKNPFKRRDDQERLYILIAQYKKLSEIRTALNAERNLFTPIFNKVCSLENVVPVDETIVRKTR